MGRFWYDSAESYSLYIRRYLERDRKTMSLRTMLERLREFDSALLANTLDFVDPTPSAQCYLSGTIQSVTPTIGPVAGVAVTAEIDSSTPSGVFDADVYWEQLEQMAAIDEPKIYVIKTVGSRPDHECVAGDGMGKGLYSVGCLGMVTDGQVRDVDALHTVPFSIHARGRCVQHCALRIKAVNTPVEIGGLTISPGDIIHAGADGVLRLPPASLEPLVEGAPRIAMVEHEAHNQLRRTDISIAEKRKRVVALYADNGFTRMSEV